MKTYFPIRIKIADEKHKDFNKEFVIEHSELPNGIAFIVLETNVKK